MADENEDTTCPLCMEEMDIIDRNFVPCPCGYRVCMWCWHHIKENMNGLCPACRLPYKEDPHAFAAVDSTEVIKKNKERKQKEKQDRKIVDLKQPAPSKGPAIDRKHLHNYRVVQRNLVYIIGIPATIASEETLRKPEYFGQYGKIAKVVVHRNHTSTHPTVSAYITFAYKEDAKAAIQALEGFWLEGHQIRASFGTTKYCNNFIRGVPCSNPECVYLHELGEDEDRFTKEEIQAGYSKLMQQPGVITGAGGPSGTGKRPTVESILPPPVFVQDPALAARKAMLSSQSNSPKLGASSSSDNIAGQDESLLSSDDKIAESKGNSVGENFNLSSKMSELDLKERDVSVTQENKTAEEKSSPLPNAGEKSDEKSLNENQNNQSKKVAPNQSSTSASSTTSSSSPSSTANPQNPQSNTNTASANPNSLNNLVSSASFNGLGNCAVFPVPVSSLTVSIWSNLLKSTSDDLKNNPYALIALPVTELFELTIPPVDAACMSIWPKPMSYYCQGVSVNGITHAPAGQHIYYRSNGFQENTSTDSSQLTTSTIPQQQQQQQQQQNQNQNSQLQQPQPQYIQSQISTQRPSGSSPARFYPPPQPPLSQTQNNSYSHVAYSGNNSTPQSQQTQPAMATLQQMFPSVNMTYGSKPTPSPYHNMSDPSQRGTLPYTNESTLR